MAGGAGPAVALPPPQGSGQRSPPLPASPPRARLLPGTASPPGASRSGPRGDSSRPLRGLKMAPEGVSPQARQAGPAAAAPVPTFLAGAPRRRGSPPRLEPACRVGGGVGGKGGRERSLCHGGSIPKKQKSGVKAAGGLLGGMCRMHLTAGLSPTCQ